MRSIKGPIFCSCYYKDKKYSTDTDLADEKGVSSIRFGVIISKKSLFIKSTLLKNLVSPNMTTV